ncbi:unnamed protein product [Arctogadus glacialis]
MSRLVAFLLAEKSGSHEKNLVPGSFRTWVALWQCVKYRRAPDEQPMPAGGGQALSATPGLVRGAHQRAITRRIPAMQGVQGASPE